MTDGPLEVRDIEKLWLISARLFEARSDFNNPNRDPVEAAKYVSEAEAAYAERFTAGTIAKLIDFALQTRRRESEFKRAYETNSRVADDFTKVIKAWLSGNQPWSRDMAWLQRLLDFDAETYTESHGFLRNAP